MIDLFITLFYSIIILAISSRVVVDASVKISQITKLSEMAIGFLIISVVTTLPELAVSFSAMTSGNIGISIGNLLGSNVTNISLIVGLSAIIAPMTIKIKKREMKRLTLILFLSSLVPLILLGLGELSHLVGLLLVMFFIYFCFYTVKEKLTLKSLKLKKIEKAIYPNVFILCFGLFFIIISARVVVDSTSTIADIFGLKQSIIGATIIALSTSLPELSVVLSAVKLRRIGIALGDAIGSCLTNLTLVLGIVLAFSSFTIDMTVFTTITTYVLISSLFFWYFVSDEKIQRREGIILLFIYFLFIITTFGVQVTLLGLFSPS